MEPRAFLVAALALPTIIWTTSPAAIAQTVAAEPPNILDVLPEATQRWIGGNPDRALQSLLISLRKIDSDGDITFDDLASSEAAAFAKEVAKYLSNLLEMDLEGDGTITADEYQRHAIATRKKNPSGFAKLASAVDTNLDGVLSLDEIRAHAEMIARNAPRRGRTAVGNPYDLRLFDQNGDGTIAETEITDMVNAAAAELIKLSGPGLRPDAGCATPVPPPGAQIVLLSGYEGAGLSTVSANGMDAETTVATITIDEGNRPLYILATAYDVIIWKVEGAVDRVANFVVQPPRVSLGPGAGVVGLASEVVSFVAPGACMKHFTKPDEGHAKNAAKQMATHFGIEVDEITVVAHYKLHAVQVPSGAAQKKRGGSYLGITFTTRKKEPDEPEVDHQRMRPPPPGSAGEALQARRGGLPNSRPVPTAPTTATPPTDVDPEEIEELTKSLLNTHPAGVIEIDPSTVVSPGIVKPYDVLPVQAGLIQLLKSGALRKTSEKTYVVLRAIPRLPAGWTMHTSPFRKIVFGKGVPMPGQKPTGE